MKIWNSGIIDIENIILIWFKTQNFKIFNANGIITNGKIAKTSLTETYKLYTNKEYEDNSKRDPLALRMQNICIM